MSKKHDTDIIYLLKLLCLMHNLLIAIIMFCWEIKESSIFYCISKREIVAKVNLSNMKCISFLEYKLYIPIAITSCCIQIFLVYIAMIKNAVPINNIEPFQSTL